MEQSAHDLFVGGVQVAANLALSAGNTSSLFEEIGFIQGTTNLFSYVDNVTIQRSTSASVLPFREPFDSLNLGNLNGQRDWFGTNAVVQSAVSFLGSKAGSLTGRTARIEHSFVGGHTNVWTALFIRTPYGTAPLPPSGSTFAFYVDLDGHVVAYDGHSRTQLAQTVVEDTWVRFATYSDYASKNWDLYLNNRLIAEDLRFYNSGVTEFTAFGLSGAPSNSATYVDNIYVGKVPAASDGTVLVVR